MDISNINTDNKTITLPLSEYLYLIDESKNQNYYKITGDLVKSIIQIRSELIRSKIYNKEVIWNTFFECLKNNNLEIQGDGGLSRIK